MKERLLRVLAVLPGSLIILAVVALPWVTLHLARKDYTGERFPLLPFSNGFVVFFSEVLIVIEFVLGIILAIGTGAALIEAGLEWCDNRSRRSGS